MVRWFLDVVVAVAVVLPSHSRKHDLMCKRRQRAARVPLVPQMTRAPCRHAAAEHGTCVLVVVWVVRWLVGFQVTTTRVLRVIIVVHLARQERTTFSRQTRKRLVTPHCLRDLARHTSSEQGAPVGSGTGSGFLHVAMQRRTMRARHAWKRLVTPQIRRERFTQS